MAKGVNQPPPFSMNFLVGVHVNLVHPAAIDGERILNDKESYVS